jgi:predicted RecB family endonuclease
VSRVINNYLSVQQDFIAQDMLNAVNSRFTTADIIAEIVSVKSSLAMDAIEILIELRNLDKNTIFVRAGAML